MKVKSKSERGAVEQNLYDYMQELTGSDEASAEDFESLDGETDVYTMAELEALHNTGIKKGGKNG